MIYVFQHVRDNTMTTAGPAAVLKLGISFILWTGSDIPFHKWARSVAVDRDAALSADRHIPWN